MDFKCRCGSIAVAGKILCARCAARRDSRILIGKIALLAIGSVALIAGLTAWRKYNDEYSYEAQQARYRAAMTPEQRKEIDDAKAESEDRRMAQMACQQFVKASLHDPSGSDLDLSETYLTKREANGAWFVVVKGRARNAFNALRAITVACTAHKSGTTWTPVSLTQVD